MTTSFDEPALSLIEEHVRRLLDVMGFATASVRCTVGEKGEGRSEQLLISIDAGEDSKLLIGTHGAHLAALQHVIRSLLRQQLEQPAYIILDVNGYRSRREQALATLAESAATRATRQGRTVVLKPMNSHERRMVHTTLAERSDITTESLGDEPNRRVVVKPVFI